MKKTIAAGALVLSLVIVGCNNDKKATPVPATEAPAAATEAPAAATEAPAAATEAPAEESPAG